MGGTDMAAAAQGLVAGLERDHPEVVLSSRIKAAWDRIADDMAAAHVVSVYVVEHTGGGEVVAYVDTALAAADLSMQAEMLRLKLNMELARGGTSGPIQVDKLTFRLSGEEYRPRAKMPPADDVGALAAADQAVQPVALDAGEEAELRAATSQIDDERLARAAYGAAKASLEWRRGLDAAQPAGKTGTPGTPGTPGTAGTPAAG